MKGSKGFTLVELLVTVGLIAVITIISSDFVLNLVSASVRIQNKATLEQNYNFITSKIIKMIQESDFVTVDNSSKITLSLEGNIYEIELKDNQILFDGVSLTNISTINISSEETFKYISSSNPQQIRIKMKFDIVQGSNLGATQEFDRIVTVLKSYKN